MPAPAFPAPPRAPVLAISRLTIATLTIAIDLTAGDASAHAGGKPAGRMIR